MKYAIVVALLLAGCGNAMDVAACRASVSAKFAPCEVQPMPSRGSSYTFIVRKPDGAIWYAACLNWTDAEVSTSCELFPARGAVESK